MTTPADLYAFCVAQRRTASIPGFRCDVLDGFTRYTPLRPDWDGIIVFANLPDAHADAAIAAQIAYFAEQGLAFEWKVYTFDQPADLADRLLRHGLIAGETEAFMLYPLAEHDSQREVAGIQIRRLQTSAQIKALVTLHENLAGGTIAWLESALEAARDRQEIFGAYDGEKLVGTGWTEFPPHSPLADLHGGAVLPDYRGRGIYRALFDARAVSARSRGIEWLTVDASPMSRPILLRQGFRWVCETTPFRREPSPTTNLSDRNTA